MSNITDGNRTERNRFTRMCIGEAVIALMKKKEYDKIKVSEIVEKAGVSRMTYYHYYESKLDVLEDYFREIISMYISACEERDLTGRFHSLENISFALEFFDNYADFLLTLNRAGLYSVLIKGMNQYMMQNYVEMYPGSVYEMYYYAGGLLNAFIQWQENGKDRKAEEIAHTIEQML